MTIRVVLAAVFLLAAVGKALDAAGTRRALSEFGAPQWAISPGAWLLPAAELAVAAALLFAPTARAGAVGAFVLLLLFVAAIARTLRAGSAPDCHCFGQFHSSPAGPATLGRNVSLAALSALVALEGPERGIGAAFVHRDATVLALVATSLAAVLLAAAYASLWIESRKLRADAEASARVQGLPVGTPAPGFSLPDRAGRIVTLENLLARGLPVVLVLVHPECGPCHELVPQLSRWVASISERVTVAAVSAGAFVAEAGELAVLTARGFEIADAYAVRTTPSSIGIDVEGRIDTGVALGPLGVEEMIRATLRASSATVGLPAEGARAN